MSERKTLDERQQMTDLERLRHSCAHVMATAILRIWPDAQFAYGPPIESGFPVTITQSSNNTQAYSRLQRPNLVPGVAIATAGSVADRIDGYFNPAAFTQAVAGAFGNAPRTLDVRSPAPQKSWDLGLLKNTDIFESMKAQFRIEAISACGEAQIIASVPELQKMCFDMDRDVRLEAIWALGKIGDERALHTLQRCTRDPDPEVSEVAHDAIEELGIAAAIARGEYAEGMDEDDLMDFEAEDDADWDDDAEAEDERE